MNARSKSVVDTGVLISAFAFGGIPNQAILRVINNTQIYVSPKILVEYREVPILLLKSKKINTSQFNSLISGVAAFVSDAKIIFPLESVDICRDPEDNMLLECCKAAKADYLITGDRDLLDIGKLPFNLKITTPRQFLLIFKKS